METFVHAVAIIGASIGFALLGQAIVRRRVAHDALAAHTDVAGFIYAALAVIYAVILAQVVVASWGDFQDARRAADDEAGSFLNLIRLADGWSEDDRNLVEESLLAYGRSVVEDEWPAMQRGEVLSPTTTLRMTDVWHAYAAVEAGPAATTARFAESLSELDELNEARGRRLLASKDTLPPLMWVVLIVGGVLTVGFAYLFAVESRRSQALMLSALAALIALLLLLARALDTPFQGDTRVTPDALEQILQRVEVNAVQVGATERERMNKMQMETRFVTVRTGSASGEKVRRMSLMSENGQRVLPNDHFCGTIARQRTKVLRATLQRFRFVGRGGGNRFVDRSSPDMERYERPMRPALLVKESNPRVSRLIAEALVQRHGPRRIVASATRLGLPPQLTRAMVVACSATALDSTAAPRVFAGATS